MKTLIAILAGSLYSAAYVAPAPYWLVALILSTACVIVMRII